MIEPGDFTSLDDVRSIFEYLKVICEQRGLSFQAYVAGIGALSLCGSEELRAALTTATNDAVRRSELFSAHPESENLN